MPGRAAGTGRFNLASGTVGAMNAIAAAASTAITGLVFQNFGHGVTFSLIAAVAASATVMSWLFLSETRPARYWD
jgi:sugar phosphate permease